jgi:hypothetical protein
MPTDLLPSLPEAPVAAARSSSEPGPPASRLAAVTKPCTDRGSWRPVRIASSSAWRHCGDWSSETVVARGRDTVIRSVATGTKAWTGGEPPPALPLFIATSPNGEEVRVWEHEAWVFFAKTPRRVVYFTKPQ